VNHLFFLLALVGTTLIVVRGAIFDPIRRVWPTFFGCSMCVGMWVGMGASVFGVVTLGRGKALDMYVVGAATSFCSLLADAVMLRLLGDPHETRNGP